MSDRNDSVGLLGRTKISIRFVDTCRILSLALNQ